jgi:hypothetical protein
MGMRGVYVFLADRAKKIFFNCNRRSRERNITIPQGGITKATQIFQEPKNKWRYTDVSDVGYREGCVIAKQ